MSAPAAEDIETLRRERDEARKIAKSYADDMLAISEGKNSGVWGGIAATAIREYQAAVARAEQAEATVTALQTEIETLRQAYATSKENK